MTDSAVDADRLYNEWRALAFFELVLFASAPHIMLSDTWVQHITGSKVRVVGTQPHSFDQDFAVDLLLRTDIGRDIMERFSQVEWMSVTFATLQSLRNESMYEEGFDPTLINDKSGTPNLFVITAKTLLRLQRSGPTYVC